MVACYKVNYLPVGVRIRFRVNCGSRVFGVKANLSSEIGIKMTNRSVKISYFRTVQLLSVLVLFINNVSTTSLRKLSPHWIRFCSTIFTVVKVSCFLFTLYI